MEKIQNHPIRDIWRVKDGLLIEINKYESLDYYVSGKRTEKRVRGCKGLTVLTADFTDSWDKNKAFSKGTFFLHGTPVRPIEDVSKFTADIKSSGGSIYGSMGHINKVMNDIKEIIRSYV